MSDIKNSKSLNDAEAYNLKEANLKAANAKKNDDDEKRDRLVFMAGYMQYLKNIARHIGIMRQQNLKPEEEYKQSQDLVSDMSAQGVPLFTGAEKAHSLSAIQLRVLTEQLSGALQAFLTSFNGFYQRLVDNAAAVYPRFIPKDNNTIANSQQPHQVQQAAVRYVLAADHTLTPEQRRQARQAHVESLGADAELFQQDCVFNKGKISKCQENLRDKLVQGDFLEYPEHDELQELSPAHYESYAAVTIERMFDVVALRLGVNRAIRQFELAMDPAETLLSDFAQQVNQLFAIRSLHTQIQGLQSEFGFNSLINLLDAEIDGPRRRMPSMMPTFTPGRF